MLTVLDLLFLYTFLLLILYSHVINIDGYEVKETYDLELSDLILDFLSKDISKEDVAKHLKENAIKR